MEFVMNKIMSIDKDAENFRKGIDELTKEKQDELEITIKDMRDCFKEESENIKNAIGNEKIVGAENKARNIRIEKEEALNNINAKYQSSKSELIEVLYNRILKLL